MINFSCIQTFCTVVESKSFTAAAHRLHLSQPSVSQHVIAVENLFDAALISRIGNRIELTDEGKLVYPHLKSMQKELHHAFDALNRLRNKPEGILEVAATFSIGDYLLPQILTAFFTKYPDINVKLKVMNTKDAVNALVNGVYPLALVGGYVNQGNISKIRFASYDMVLIVPAGHVLANREASVDELVDLKWVIREEGSGTREVMENYLHALGIQNRAKVIMELGSTEAVKKAVISGMGASFVSRMAIIHELELGLLAEVKVANEKPCLRHLYMITPKMSRKTFLVEAFMQFLMRSFNEKPKIRMKAGSELKRAEPSGCLP